MKKSVIFIAVLMMFLLCGCGHTHTWVDATCTEPKTCSECGETEGDPLGHTWVDATCTEPKTCSLCGETEGEPLGHSEGEWSPVDPEMIGGKERLTCSICGEVINERDSGRENIEPREVITVDGFTLLSEEEFLNHLVSYLPSGYSINPNSGFANRADIYYKGEQVMSVDYQKDTVIFSEHSHNAYLRLLAPYLVDAIEPNAKETDYYDSSMQLIEERLKYKEQKLYTIPMSVGVCCAAYTPYESKYVGDNYFLVFTTLRHALGF